MPLGSPSWQIRCLVYIAALMLPRGVSPALAALRVPGPLSVSLVPRPLLRPVAIEMAPHARRFIMFTRCDKQALALGLENYRDEPLMPFLDAVNVTKSR